MRKLKTEHAVCLRDDLTEDNSFVQDCPMMHCDYREYWDARIVEGGERHAALVSRIGKCARNHVLDRLNAS